MYVSCIGLFVKLTGRVLAWANFVGVMVAWVTKQGTGWH